MRETVSSTKSDILDHRGRDGWMASPTQWLALEDGEGLGSLACCVHGVARSRTRLSDWTTITGLTPNAEPALKDPVSDSLVTMTCGGLGRVPVFQRKPRVLQDTSFWPSHLAPSCVPCPSPALDPPPPTRPDPPPPPQASTPGILITSAEDPPGQPRVLGCEPQKWEN